MRSIANIVTLLSSSERNSMRAMISGLEHLPPISLAAEIVGDDVGEGAHGAGPFRSRSAGFKPDFLVQPSSGVVLETVINYFLGGRQIRNGNEIGPDGRVVGGGVTFGTPGAYVAVVTRTGITNVGITVLKKELNFTVTFPRPSAHK